MKEYALQSIKHFKSSIKDLEKDLDLHTVKTLKTYGLDPKSLLVTCAFSIAETKLTYFKEPSKNVLSFYEPYIKSNLDFAGNSQLDLYAKLLIRTNQEEEGQKILEFAKEKYSYSPLIIYTLSNLYLKNNNIEKAEEIIQEGYNYYPSYKRMLLRMIKLAEARKDYISFAKLEYLLGLRMHSKEAYQKATQIYLFANKLNEAKRILDKLISIDSQDPITLLLLSKFYYLNGNREKVLDTLNKAYSAIKSSQTVKSLPVYRSVLLSLISFNLSYNNVNDAKIYITELQQIPNLPKQELTYIEEVKKKFKL